jgi:amidase
VSSAPFGSLEGLSTAAPLSRTVLDAAALLDVMAGYEPGDPWWAPPPERPFADEVLRSAPPLRIAVAHEPPVATPVDRECVAALDDAAALLSDLGHVLVDGSPPWRDDDLALAFIAVWQLGPALQPLDDLSLLTPLNRELVESSRALSAADYGRTVARLQAYARRVVAFWGTVDVVLTPTLALPSVPIGWQDAATGAVEQLLRNVEFTPFTAVANLTGLPAMSLPLHWSAEGMPVGVQAIGPPAGEALLLRLAAQLEAARPWTGRRPGTA